MDKDGYANVFIKKEDFPKKIFNLNDVTVDTKGNGIYISDMGAAKYMRDENSKLWPLDSEQAKSVPQAGRIYHIDLEGHATIVQDSSPLRLNPNGMGIDHNGSIMIGEFFLGNFLVQRDGELTSPKGKFRGVDAFEQDSKIVKAIIT